MNKKILVIDDSATMRSMLMSTIEEMKGVEVVEASNGFEALKALPLKQFDLIITDINMPEINGLEIVHFVKNNPLYQKIPLIILSTENGAEDIKKGLALGAQKYITKPFDPDDLKKTVKEILCF
ncbi:MAG TPA: response regulator [Candidatus Manganitrophaceae bacterium]